MATLDIVSKEVQSQFFFLHTLQWAPAAPAAKYSCGDDRQLREKAEF